MTLPDPLHPFDAYPGYLLRRAARMRLSRLTMQLTPLALTVTQASILVMIGHNPGVSQVECGRRLGVQRANMNPMVRRMVDAGWIGIGKGQGRAQELTLTQGGQDLAQRVEAAFEEHEAWILSSVPDHLRAAVMPILRALCGIPDAG
jgi:DNA-binding MarR family transcriptional regulator